MATQRFTPGEAERPGTGIGESVKNAAGNAAQAAREAAGDVAGKVKEHTRKRTDEGRESTASGLASVAQAVRRAGEDLRNQEQPGIVAQRAADYGEALATRIDRTSEYLRTHDVGQILGEVERFARRRPSLFLGGAFLVGFALTRFLKSSRPAGQGYWAAVDEHSEARGPGSFRPAERWGEPGLRGSETWSEPQPYPGSYPPPHPTEA